MSYLGTKSELKKTREEKQIEWEIHHFFSLPKIKKFYCQSFPFTFADDSWHLSFFPEGNEGAEDGFMSLYLSKNTDLPCNVTFTLGLKRTDGKLTGERIFTHKFTKDCWGLLNFSQRSELLKQKSELLPSDILTVVCSLKLGPGQTVTLKDPLLTLAGEFCNRQNVDATSQTEKYEEKKGYNLCQDFKNMLLNGQDHDLTLKVRDKEIRAHQNILRSRSDVFDSMLRCHMVEKITGVIDVPDCDPQAFEQFLVYMYSGEVEILDQTNMLGLYYIADKYNVTHLKEECREFIKQFVSSTNICDIIQLSLDHSDSILLECATGYFVNNVKDILPTVEWQHFVKTCPIEANELFIKLTSKWYDSKI